MRTFSYRKISDFAFSFEYLLPGGFPLSQSVTLHSTDPDVTDSGDENLAAGIVGSKNSF